MWDPKRMFDRTIKEAREAPRTEESRPRIAHPERVLRPNFAQRRAALAILGFKTYEQYRTSDVWKRIRSAVRARSGGVCELCLARRSRMVHHYAYDIETMRGDDIRLVVDTCGRCHIIAHTWPKREQLTVRSQMIVPKEPIPQSTRQFSGLRRAWRAGGRRGEWAAAKLATHVQKWVWRGVRRDRIARRMGLTVGEIELLVGLLTAPTPISMAPRLVKRRG